MPASYNMKEGKEDSEKNKDYKKSVAQLEAIQNVVSI